MGLEGDHYLLRFDVPGRTHLLVDFMASVHRGGYSSLRHKGPLVSGTIKQSLSNLALTLERRTIPPEGVGFLDLR